MKREPFERTFLFSSFLILSLAAILSFILEPAAYTIIPNPKITVPVINTLCAVLAFLLLVTPTNIYIESFILILQSLSTTLTGYELLGVFLYSANFILMFCYGFFRIRAKRKIIAYILFWLVITPGILPFGIDRYFLAIGTSFFIIGFYGFVYAKLQHILTPLIPAKLKTKIPLPAPGSKLDLAAYNLTDRQIQLVKAYLATGNSYAQLAKKMNMSTSLIKKEMSETFTKLGVKNIKELHLLLLQYQL